MEKEYKYRIKVELIGEPDKDGLKLLETVGEGIECNGFVILGNNGERTLTLIHNMNIKGIAESIMPDKELMQAAILAQAYFNTEMVMKEHALQSMSELIAEVFKSKEE